MSTARLPLLCLLALLVLLLGCPPTGDDDDASNDDDAADDDDSAGDDDDATDDDDDSASGDDDDSAGDEPVWWYTCGDPVCSGYTPSGNPLCTTQTIGAACSPIGDVCDPAGDGCNRQILCEIDDPTAGPVDCPISSKKYKDGVEYLTEADREALAEELLSVRLARYQYSLSGQPEGTRLGFIIEDQPDSPAVDGEHVDFYGYASMLVATVQAQQQQLEQLQAEVASLRQQCGAKPEAPSTE